MKFFDEAKHPWRPWQRSVFIGIIIGLVVQASLSLKAFIQFWNITTLTFFSIIILIKVIAVFIGQFRRFTVSCSAEELAALDESTLPVYTILAPMYREPEVVGDFVQAMKRLDYPQDKLDIKLLLEQDDEATLRAARAQQLPPSIEIVIVPEGYPKTKPRACNYGLERARGEFLVIFDAEDRPEPDQLKKAICAFRKLPDKVDCLQAKLNYYNGHQNLLAKWFTLEYSAWFDLYLPGLHALRSPIPLGGTSNHFRTSALKTLGGWDAYNVTEDCDLGIRLSLARRDIRILDSTTWEEACCKLRPWLRQRSRWIKGYWQTLLIHTRSPLKSMLTLGPWEFLLLLAVIGGQVYSMIVMPICWVVIGAWLTWEWELFDPSRPWTAWLFAGALLLMLLNGFFVLIHLIAGLRRQYYRMLFPGLFMPIYWLLMSWGAWRGFLQFFWAPFQWMKTPHGLSTLFGRKHEQGFHGAYANESSLGPAWTVLPFCIGLLLLGIATIVIPIWMGLPEQLSQREIRLDSSAVANEIKIEEDWFAYQYVNLELFLEGIPPNSMKSIRPMIYIKVNDGEWFQAEPDSSHLKGSTLHMHASLSKPWRGRHQEDVWGRWQLRRVREIGVKVYTGDSYVQGASLMSATPGGEAPLGNFTLASLDAPDDALCNQVYEANFTLNREYDNPFDPDEIDLMAEFIAPSGKTTRLPAFYKQDYVRNFRNNAEVLRAIGTPQWAVRFMPDEPGQYRWRLTGSDRYGDALDTSYCELDVHPSEYARGYLKSDPEHPEYFAFSNGEFYYPMAINLCWPRDNRTFYDLKNFTYLNPKTGTYLYDDFFQQMQRNKIDMGRVWMTAWWCGLEWYKEYPTFHGVGRYSMQRAWELDYLMEAALRKDIMIELALNHHGPFTQRWDDQWTNNPYRVENGGWLKHYTEAMTDQKTRDLFKRRHRYVAARWGAYPNLFGYTLWIENDTTNPNPNIRANWHKEMAGYLREIDQDRHLISTEFVKDAGDIQTWQLDDITYTQAAAYTVDDFSSVMFKRLYFLSSVDKPRIIEEYGGHPKGTSIPHLKLQLHNGPWIVWHMPASGAPMPWWWNLIFQEKLDEQLKIFADYIEGVDLREQEWKYMYRQPVNNANGIYCMSRTGQHTAFLWFHNKDIVDKFYEAPWMFTGDQDAMLFNPPVDNAEFIFDSELRDGHYTLEFWDTWYYGKIETRGAECRGGRMTIELPRMIRDMAVKIQSSDAPSFSPAGRDDSSPVIFGRTPKS
ncbi:glycosyltransferase [Candidatus Sumerlaeota bacterium]|nr:glycosyltransferase [Candidatus Sumerlaeota bacterium]